MAKIFNVKPKVVSGEHAECGGAMVSKMPNVTWTTCAFNDSVKEWQQQWFYITEPRGTEWALLPSSDPEPLCGLRPGPRRA